MGSREKVRRSSTRVLLATLLSAGVGGCSIFDSAFQAPTTVADPESVEREDQREDTDLRSGDASAVAEPRLLRPERDVVRRPGGAMAADQPNLVVEPTAGSALLAFDVPVDERRCIAEATLSVPVVESTFDAAVLVSLETELLDLPDGSSLGATVVKPGSPSSQFLPPENGHFTWDVTELVAWSAETQTEPVLVFAVMPHFSGADLTNVVLGATESDNAATLGLVPSSSCPGSQP